MSVSYILCPGQGAQHMGMGKDFAEAFPSAKAIFQRANEVLGFDLAEICFHDRDACLNQTDVSQPAIYVTSVACHAAAQAADRLAETSHIFAGLSLGEYTALYLAGVFSFEDGLKLVAARGRAMQAAADATPGTMAAVMGADEAQIMQLCASESHGEVLVSANFNAPGQIVVSGTKPACERFAVAAALAGLRVVPLTVAGAFHSPLMQSAADLMREELSRTQFNPPLHPVYSNVTAALHTDVESIKSLLVDQIVKPVRWEQIMNQLAHIESAKFVELAPGKVLTGLLKKQNRRADILTLNEAASLRI
jgi:[acyl-carrier-protein] S-malonyltransferase